MPKSTSSVFKTFKPQHQIVSQFVQYYYLEFKPENEYYEFTCFPHFNNSLSIRPDHRIDSDRNINYQASGNPLFIYTPIRKEILKVKQVGRVHRIVIIFNPMGIYQFYKNLDFTETINDIDFFTKSEVNNLFQTLDATIIGSLLDEYLSKRFERYEHPIMTEATNYIFNHYSEFSVALLADYLQISRRHLNRLFQQFYGTSIKKFHEIVVFRKLINNKIFEDQTLNLTQLAYNNNLSDQSHMNKMFAQFCKLSPSTFFNDGSLLGTEDTFWHIK